MGFNITSLNSTSNITAPINNGLVYKIAIPILIVICVVSVLANGIIVIGVGCLQFGKKTPLLTLTLSLAGADAYVASVMAVSFFVNSYLPMVAGINLSEQVHCVMLAFEALRMGSMITSMFHLLILAVNHYIGISRPLHYRVTMTRGVISILIAVMWIIPPLLLLIYFGSIPGQGFQSHYCNGMGFYFTQSFRLCFSMFLFVPLCLMLWIYVQVFILLQRNRSQFSGGNSYVASIEHNGTREISRSVPSISPPSFKKDVFKHMEMPRRCYSERTPPINCVNPEPDSEARSHNCFRKRSKAVETTVIILGTYIIGWMPAMSRFILVCNDCLFTGRNVNPRSAIAMGIICNSLILLKCLLDPVIYAARVKEVQNGFWVIWATRCGFKRMSGMDRSATLRLMLGYKNRKQHHLSAHYSQIHNAHNEVIEGDFPSNTATYIPCKQHETVNFITNRPHSRYNLTKHHLLVPNVNSQCNGIQLLSDPETRKEINVEINSKLTSKFCRRHPGPGHNVRNKQFAGRIPRFSTGSMKYGPNHNEEVCLVRDNLASSSQNGRRTAANPRRLGIPRVKLAGSSNSAPNSVQENSITNCIDDKSEYASESNGSNGQSKRKVGFV